MKLLFILAMFAEILPSGCYIESGQTQRYETTAPTIGFYTHNILPANQEIDYYGQVVASLLDAYFEEQKELKVMTRKYNLLRRGIKK